MVFDQMVDFGLGFVVVLGSLSLADWWKRLSGAFLLASKASTAVKSAFEVMAELAPSFGWR